MLIETYFKQIQQTIESQAIVQTFNLTFDKRGTNTGFVRGEVFFIDGSVLHVREFVDVELTLDRLMYVYHYVDASQKLIFRYDDTGHHKDLALPTFPHHKHIGSENNITHSHAPDLTDVLTEIMGKIEFPG